SRADDVVGGAVTEKEEFRAKLEGHGLLAVKINQFDDRAVQSSGRRGAKLGARMGSGQGRRACRSCSETRANNGSSCTDRRMGFRGGRDHVGPHRPLRSALQVTALSA